MTMDEFYAMHGVKNYAEYKELYYAQKHNKPDMLIIDSMTGLSYKPNHEINEIARKIKEMVLTKFKDLDFRLIDHDEIRTRIQDPLPGPRLRGICGPFGFGRKDTGSSTYKLHVLKQRGREGQAVVRIPLEKQAHVSFRDVQIGVEDQITDLCDETICPSQNAEPQ